MKPCNSCIKEIDNKATKCPHCQSFQKWYQNKSVFFYWVFFFPLFMYWIFFSIPIEKNYNDYKEDIALVKVDEAFVGNEKTLYITYKIENNTDYKWNRITYEMQGFKDDKLISSTYENDYYWLVQPNSESLLTVKIPKIQGVNQWKLAIKDLNHERY